ncbi:ABC transporter ATP-binding protein [Williamsia sp. D3]|uniref:ABC transporter ATP-binding protein n=1 Tax=Williamsia sp. D3 TaxID=1313067 RepID=UPI0003D2B9B1|nr:ABC transporter ATP-binding protein [Williamsia sp. D3]ETD32174.1 multidrug ABC transporter ATP-binding protein [Williamsia sp. D3]
MNLKWLLARLTHERRKLFTVGLLASTNVAALIAGPLILAGIINALFTGAIGMTLPQGLSAAEAEAQLRADGRGSYADVVAGADAVPGVGIDFGTVGTLLAVLVIVYAISALGTWTQAAAVNNLTQRAMNRLRADIESHIHRLPVAYFDTAARGQMLTKVTADIDNVSSVFTPLFVKLPGAVLTVVALLVVMPIISWKLTLVVLASIPLIILAGVLIAKRSRPHFRDQMEATARLTSQIDESYAQLHTLRVYGAQNRARDEFEATTERLARSSRTAQSYAGSVSPVLQAITAFGYLTVAIVGAIQVVGGSLTVGQVQAFVSFSRMFSQPVNELTSMMAQLQAGLVSLGRIKSLLAEPVEDAPAIEDSAKQTIGRHSAPPAIAFDKVRFGYRRSTEDDTKTIDVIKDLSMEVEAGSTVAVVGPTGAGKTTLTNLLLRLYDPSSGSVLVDGEPINTAPRSYVRGQAAMVTQDRWLFTGTIAENIAFGNPSATRADIEEAARESHALQIVEALPEGFDTVIGDGGTTLSEGQMQLLTIARAMIARPRILVLDEATSAVDSRTELLIARALEALTTRTTTIVVAHRLSTIREADSIAVIEDGVVAEQGTHDELLARQGRYSVMYKSQFE